MIEKTVSSILGNFKLQIEQITKLRICLRCSRGALSFTLCTSLANQSHFVKLVLNAKYDKTQIKF